MITGLKKVEHIGFTVPDLEEAVTFFKELFGAEIIAEGSNFEFPDNWMKDHLDVHPRAKIEKIQTIKLPDNTCFELFQYKSPDQNGTYPKNSDIGGHHLTFEVDDIEESVSFLKQKGIRVLGSPTYNDPSWENINGDLEGIKWVYFQTSWGLNMELIEKKENRNA
jgi:catechol 2,3-dioxygenase-like lactoylglutathione lyase family enzyme